MNRISSLLLSLCLVLSLGFALGVTQAAAEDLPGVDAKELLARVTQAKGKVVVVNVFASWCPPCRDEIPGLVNVRRSLPDDQVLILGVSVDKEPKALTKYMKDLNINYPVLLARGDFIQRVGVTAVPQLLIYDRKGELVFNHRGLVDEADLRQAITEAGKQ